MVADCCVVMKANFFWEGGGFSKSGKNKQLVKMKTKNQKLNILNKDKTIQCLLLRFLSCPKRKITHLTEKFANMPRASVHVPTQRDC